MRGWQSTFSSIEHRVANYFVDAVRLCSTCMLGSEKASWDDAGESDTSITNPAHCFPVRYIAYSIQSTRY
jgi:hypothetical protein